MKRMLSCVKAWGVPFFMHCLSCILQKGKLPGKCSAGMYLRYVVAVGQLIPLKRFELLIDAMVTLSDDCRLVLLDDGDRAPYQARAAGLGIAVPVMTSTEDISSYLASADILTLLQKMIFD